MSTNLFIEIASIIKDTNMNIRQLPGTKIASSRNEIIYRPPEGEAVIRDKLANLEQFIHREDDGIDPLVKMAVIHYQFEAIHPFVDGNGRTGRIINILYLIEKGLLESPVLCLSHYILRTKSIYYKNLRQVTENSAWINWILYMLEAIEETALETQQRVLNTFELMEKAKQEVQSKAPKIYSKDLIEIIFRHPYCKVRFIEEAGLAKR